MNARWALPWLFFLLCPGNLAPSIAQTTAQRGVRLDSLARPSVPDPSGHYYALVIGNNSYQEFTQLQTARNDATEIARVLQNNYGFETKLLLDATRDQILGALDDYRGNLQREDSLLVYYAGHGWDDKKADEAYWIPVDGQKDKKAHWINAAEITGDARAMAARHVLIISDSCYSGTLTDRGDLPTVSDPRRRDSLVAQALEGKSRHVMSSGGDEPVSDITPGYSSDHSVFANALLHYLREIPQSEFVGKELYLKVYEQVGGESRQQPEYNVIRDSGHNSGDFVFFRKAPSVIATVKAEGVPTSTSLGASPAGTPTSSEPPRVAVPETASLRSPGSASPTGGGAVGGLAMELAPLLSIDRPPGLSSSISKIQLDLLGSLNEAGTDREILSLAFSPTDRHLLAAASFPAFWPDYIQGKTQGGGHGSVGLWDLTGAQVARSLQNSGHDRPLDRYTSLAYSRDGTMLAVVNEGPVGGKMDVVQLWDVNTGALKEAFGAGALDGPEAVAFSPDGRMIAAGSCSFGDVCIYSTTTGELIKSLKHPGVIASLAFSNDGKTLAVGDRDWHPSVRLWDVGTWTRARDLNPPQPSYGEAVAFSPDGKTLATGHYRGGVCLWDYRTGVRLRTLQYKDTEGGHALAFSPDGRFLTFVSGHHLQFWDPGNGKLLGDFDIDADNLSLHPNGLLLATVDAPTGVGAQQQGARSIRIWRLRYSSAN